MSSDTQMLHERMLAFYKLFVIQDGKPPQVDDLDKRLAELFTDDIVFESPVFNRTGIKVFTKSWKQQIGRNELFGWDEPQLVGPGEDGSFVFVYTMTMVPKSVKVPISLPLTSVFYPDETGTKVGRLIDFYDTVGALAAINPQMNYIYRQIVARLIQGGPPDASDYRVLLPLRTKDGIWHPRSEAELSKVIADANEKGQSVRVVGSGHSVWEAIVPNGVASTVQPTDPGVTLIMLDGFRERTLLSDGRVEVEAGCNLGMSPRLAVGNPISVDPKVREADPNVTRGFGWDESLNQFLQDNGLALPDLGGISHQTVGGFLSTGSAGGTTMYSLLAAVESIRIVDAEGKVHVLTEDGDDPDYFLAAGVSLGLCGVISKVTFKCVPTFNIRGAEYTEEAQKHPWVDFYSEGRAGVPSLRAFFDNEMRTTTPDDQAEYTRLMWWPQDNCDLLTVWKANRIDPEDGFTPHPYVEQTKLEQLAASMLFTLLGNLKAPGEALNPNVLAPIAESLEEVAGDVGSLFSSLKDVEAEVKEAMVGALGDEKGGLLAGLVKTVEGVISTAHLDGALEMITVLLDKLVKKLITSDELRILNDLLYLLIPVLIGPLIKLFVPTGLNRSNGRDDFDDFWHTGLPMDNQMDDVMMPVFFTEIWIPYTKEGGELEKAISVMRDVFTKGRTPRKRYQATGSFSFEIYACGKESRFWMSPAHGDASVVRIDVFWFGYNAGDPVADFYPQFWEALRAAGVPYRLHWGKFLPEPDQLPPSEITGQFENFDKFEAVRKRADPKGIFLSDYWKKHLGL